MLKKYKSKPNNGIVSLNVKFQEMKRFLEKFYKCQLAFERQGENNWCHVTRSQPITLRVTIKSETKCIKFVVRDCPLSTAQRQLSVECLCHLLPKVVFPT